VEENKLMVLAKNTLSVFFSGNKQVRGEAAQAASPRAYFTSLARQRLASLYPAGIIHKCI